MDYTLNPRVVLSYLNELGYTNINAQQLKEFMIDLKKLIKYHDRECSEAENLNPQFTCPPSASRDVFEELYQTDTAASKAKKTSLITVEINKPKRVVRKVSSEELVTKEDVEVQTTPCPIDVPPIKPPSPEVRSTCTCTMPSTARTISTDRKTQVSSKRPKSAFIRPRLNTKPPKSDPVALYQQYQEEWKRIKIPGQSNHADLRWEIRTKMLGGDKYDYCF